MLKGWLFLLYLNHKLCFAFCKNYEKKDSNCFALNLSVSQIAASSCETSPAKGEFLETREMINLLWIGFYLRGYLGLAFFFCPEIATKQVMYGF